VQQVDGIGVRGEGGMGFGWVKRGLCNPFEWFFTLEKLGKFRGHWAAIVGDYWVYRFWSFTFE